MLIGKSAPAKSWRAVDTAQPPQATRHAQVRDPIEVPDSRAVLAAMLRERRHWPSCIGDGHASLNFNALQPKPVSRRSTPCCRTEPVRSDSRTAPWPRSDPAPHT